MMIECDCLHWIKSSWIGSVFFSIKLKSLFHYLNFIQACNFTQFLYCYFCLIQTQASRALLSYALPARRQYACTRCFISKSSLPARCDAQVIRFIPEVRQHGFPASSFLQDSTLVAEMQRSADRRRESCACCCAVTLPVPHAAHSAHAEQGQRWIELQQLRHEQVARREKDTKTHKFSIRGLRVGCQWWRD